MDLSSNRASNVQGKSQEFAFHNLFSPWISFMKFNFTSIFIYSKFSLSSLCVHWDMNISVLVFLRSYYIIYHNYQNPQGTRCMTILCPKLSSRQNKLNRPWKSLSRTVQRKLFSFVFLGSDMNDIWHTIYLFDLGILLISSLLF